MTVAISDRFSNMESAVRIKPISNVRLIVEKLRKYGIKTSKRNSNNKIIFYQSSHLVVNFRNENDEVSYPSYAIVSFKDLFKEIGKNPEGVDQQDIVRTWVIAERLENRRIVEIQGTSLELLGKEDTPNIPNVYANLHYVNHTEEQKNTHIFKSKFATNKMYSIPYGGSLCGIGDYFILD